MKEYLKKAVRSFGLALSLTVGAVLGAAIGFGANVPLLPSTPTFSEPSQIINTINTWAQSLNGAANAITPTPANIGLGQFCSNGTAGGATPQTCVGSRGVVTFTGVTVGANANATVVITDTGFVTTGSACNAWLMSQPTAGAGATVASVTPTANTLTIVLTNATATTTGAVTEVVGFSCVN